MVERRRQGLCFNCDEKFACGHKCAHLFFIEYDDSELDDFVDGGGEVADDEPHILLYAVAGVTAADTMRLRIRIHDQELLALVNSGSSHNFIRDDVAHRLGVALQPVRSGLNVIVANGDRLPCTSVCTALDIQVGAEPFQVECFSLALGGYDVILGTQWLRTLGLILWDFSTLSLTCCLNSRRVTWLGERGRKAPSCHQLQADSLLQHLLEDFASLFTEPMGLPPARFHDHRIHLEPATRPVAVRPYRYPQLQKDEVERQCAEMLRQGIIRLSTSTFSSPVLLVKKHDGSWRFCVDYHALNAITIKAKFPIPVVEELLDELHGARFFTKLDLRSGYHQVRMHASDIAKTAFQTHPGHYEFLVMPFGLCNTPATFQALMNDILGKYLRQFVLVFFDDILIYSKTWAGHLRHVCLILDTLRQHGLRLKRSKCEFGVPNVSYLGHVVSADGVAMDSHLPSPHERHPRKTWAGHLRHICLILDTLRQHGLRLKRSKCEFGVPNVSYLGHVVSADGVAMDSQKIKAVVNWPHPGSMPALRGFLGLDAGTPWFPRARRHWWISKLMGFDFTVEYKPGSTNVVADTLSRREAAAAEAMALSSPTFHLWEELRRQLGGMPDYQHLRQEVEAGRKGSQWAIKDGLVLKMRRVFMPE
ncbi:uncharacterized protein LOC106804383 [Setaria italica]|uniref:uncharacterized protein LOC106804383 n=1 Tax=Setaria italica TaxID=4555 RepID=UPI0007199D09|nr:uncharacterized protein LOC106804383 [Setaria italica]